MAETQTQKPRRWRRWLRYAVLIGAALLLLFTGMNLWVILRSRGRIFTDVNALEPAPVAMVLGTSQHNPGSGNINLYFKYRIDAAARLYHSGKVKKLLVSGDNRRTNYDEPTAMRNSLIAAGVPAEDIICDFAGFRTFDSVVRTAKVFGQQKFIIVSQEFHLQRAIFIARAHGLEVQGYVAQDVAVRRTWLRIQAREVLARIKAVLDCYLLGTRAHFEGPAEPIQFND